MGREQAQDAAQSIRIGTDCSRQFRGRAWGLVQDISETELGNNVQTAWQRISTCQIQYRLDGIHLTLSEILADLHNCSPPLRAF
jgi:hypothetical protein